MTSRFNYYTGENMGVMEIVLIVLGMIVFVGSFLLPAGRENDNPKREQIDEKAIRELVEKEVEEARTKIGDIVDETITYAMEKTERSMDRLTNEKMLAVNEYSDTVLDTINKNHKEAVFLYDMLNDKHENLKSTVTEATKKASEVKQTVKDAEAAVREAEMAVKEEDAPAKEAETAKEVETAKEAETAMETVETGFTPMKAGKVEILYRPREEQAEVEVTLDASEKAGGRNSNERILELHKKGKSNMAIAKELGLGIGEVKLVIDLFEGQ